MVRDEDEWAEAIRRAVEASGADRWVLAKTVGIDYANLAKFMAGKAGLSLASACRLGRSVGLHLTGEPHVPVVHASIPSVNARTLAVAKPAHAAPSRRELSPAEVRKRRMLGIGSD